MRRTFYLLGVLSLLLGTYYWSTLIVPVESFSNRLVATTLPRQELIEALDRLVTYEHYYRSVYGSFTRVLGRVGFKVPIAVSSNYDIRVVRATKDHLVILAIADQSAEQASMNERYSVQSSFPLPEPRAPYLRDLAARHLRTVQNPEILTAERGAESSVFQGYFRYESDHALGIRAPVAGMVVRVDGDRAVAPTQTGQREGAASRTAAASEEEFLAQRIFRRENGRYAKNWSELSQVANFRPDLAPRMAEDFGSILETVVDLEANQDSPATGPAHETSRALASDPHPDLVIEPIR